MFGIQNLKDYTFKNQKKKEKQKFHFTQQYYPYIENLVTGIIKTENIVLQR